MKSYCYFLILSVSVIVGTFLGCDKQTQPGQKTIAVIEPSYKISFMELNKYVHDDFFHRRFRDKNEAYTRALDEMILKQLKCIDFFEKGMNEDRQLVQSIQRYINEELIVKYFESEYLGKYANEEFARKFYDQMGKEVHYQQIVLNKPKNASDDQLKSLENQVLEIKAQAEKGVNFKELIKKYAETGAESDEYSKAIMDWRSSMDTPHNRVIFNLNKGEFRILDEYHAYYIINVTDVKKIKLEPFTKLKNELISKLSESYYHTSLNEYDRDKNNAVDPNEIKWNEKALDQIIEWSKIPKFYTDIYVDTMQKAIADGRNMTIFTYPEGQIDLYEFLRLLNEILILSDSRDLNKKTLKDFIVEAVRSDKIIRKARDLGFVKEVFHPYTNNPVLKIKIIELYDQEMIESQIPEPSATALAEFYQANRDSLYYQLEKINLYAMIYSDKSAAEQIWTKIQQGTPFNEASDRWFVKTFIKDRAGQIKSYLSKEPPYLGEAAFKLQESEVDGIIEYTDSEKGRQYAVVYCKRRIPEKQLTYNEIQGSIKDDFIKYHREKLSREVTKSLNDKYQVTIHDKVLAKILKSIDKRASSSTAKKS